jgi:hypothetical protein
MQRVVVRQRGEIDGLRELVGRYERLSRKLMVKAEALGAGVEQLTQRMSVPCREQAVMQSIYNMLDWCSNLWFIREPVARWIYGTTSEGTTWPITERTDRWQWRTYEQDGPTDFNCANVIITYGLEQDLGSRAIALYSNVRETQCNSTRILEDGKPSPRGEQTAISKVESIPPLPPCIRAECAVLMTVARLDGTTLGDGTFSLCLSVGGYEDSAPSVTEYVRSVRPDEELTEARKGFRNTGWRAIVGTYTAPTQQE